MDTLSDYTIENTSDCDLSRLLVAKHKTSGKLYHLQGIPLADLSSNDQKTLVKKIKIRTNLVHPNVLQFFDCIKNDGILYLKTEHCKYESLSCFLKKECVDKDRVLHERLLCRILYQTVFALKTVECFMGHLSLDTILLDEEFNIKLYNFYNMEPPFNQHQKQKEVKMSQLGAAVFELSTLKPFDKATFEIELQHQKYSEAFKGLVTSMLKDGSEIRKHINKILCHPTVLLQSSQWTKAEGCFLEYQKPLSKSSSSDLSDQSEYSEKLEKLRNKEAALRIKERLLKEQERKLSVRERKLCIMERTVKEKMQQAELYLKRCREGSTSSRSTNSQSSLQSKVNYNEEVDPSYVSFEDSDIFPTSTKLQVDKIVKPSNFSRTMSERRIRFKTSPLKERNVVRKALDKKSLKNSRIVEESLDLEGRTLKNNQAKRKSLFVINQEEDGLVKVPCEVTNIGWNEETKRHAFEMLRILNYEDNKENVDVKHTVL